MVNISFLIGDDIPDKYRRECKTFKNFHKEKVEYKGVQYNAGIRRLFMFKSRKDADGNMKISCAYSPCRKLCQTCLSSDEGFCQDVINKTTLMTKQEFSNSILDK